jgi:hypothetical protein
MGASPLVSAPGVACYINGKVFGLVYDFSFNSATPRKKIKSIDVLQALELAPTTSDVSFSMGIYRLRGGGGIEGANIAAPLPDLASENYFSVVLLDLVTKFVIFQALNCSVESQDWSVPLKNYITGRISCSALSWSNEVVALNGK